MQNLFTPPQFAIGELNEAEPNIFGIIGGFSKIAKRSGWTKEDINKVIEAAKATNNPDLCQAIISSHVKDKSQVKVEKLSNSEIEDLLDKVGELVDKFAAESKTIDNDSDHKDKIMETRHGEMVSAINHLYYEFRNNGLYFYGTLNNVGGHAEYLIAVGPDDLVRLIEKEAKNPNFDEDTYIQFLGQAAKMVLEYIASTEDSKNEYQKHWTIFNGRWQFYFCDYCAGVTEPWESCDCVDESEDDED